MEYKFAPNENYEDLSCGRVIYHRTGFSNYPVRLASEILQQGLEIIEKPIEKPIEKISIYDPCCGGGYLLTVLGFLHRDRIQKLYGSDISLEANELAVSNLKLLTTDGMLIRKEQLEAIYQDYQKNSHLEAIESANRLLKMTQGEINYQIFNRDILDLTETDSKTPVVDIIITDVPYGNLVSWSCEEAFDKESPINRMLDNLLVNLKENSILVISSDKKQKINNSNYTRVKKLQIGKRKIEFLMKL